MRMENKNINSLCLLLLLLFIAFLTDGFTHFSKGFADGWKEAGSEREHTFLIKNISVDLYPVDASRPADSLRNAATNTVLPYRKEQIGITVETPFGYAMTETVFGFIMLPVLLFLLVWGGLSFIRFIRDVKRRQIFTRENIKRLRVIGYGLAFIGLVGFIFDVMQHIWLLREVAVEIPGYQLAGFDFRYKSFIVAILFILFAEVFAIGLRMKEEQDLTI